MNIAICDDDTIYGSCLADLCRSLSITDTVDFYEKPEDFLNVINTIHSYDVLLMDIVLKTKKNGIDYMAELYKKCPAIYVVYITAHTDYYISKVFLQQTNISGFLQKPVDKELLSRTLQAIAEKILHDRRQLVLFQGKRPVKTINTADIQYLESNAHKAFLYVEHTSVTNLEAHMTYERLASLQKRLPPNFYACHKSYIVNMDKIVRIDRTEVLLSCNKMISISKSRYKELRTRYFDYIQTRL